MGVSSSTSPASQREDNFIGGAENTAFALGSGLVLGQIVDAETMSCDGTARGKP